MRLAAADAPRRTLAGRELILEADPSPWRMSMYGKTYFGAARATFVIDGDGTVAHVIPRVTPRTHDDEVLAVLEQLAAA
jgi:peroxiredoxin